MADSGQEKTQAPTPRKLSKARGEGNVPKSQDLGSAVVLITGISTLWILGPTIAEKLRWVFRIVLGNMLNVTLTPDTFPGYVKLGVLFFVKLMLPLFIVLIIASIAIHLFQSGFILSSKPIKPDLKKLSIIKGMKRIFSLKGLVELVKGIIKLLLVGLLVYFTIKAEIPRFIELMDQDVAAIFSGILFIAFKLAIKLALLLLILGILDWKFQKWKYMEDMKMTRQEVKDERKQTEGDPHIKGKIRRIQVKLSLNRMIEKMPEADVVVTNPVHLAVAIKYNAKTMSAPIIIAKGKRKLAEKIKSIAYEHDIPVIEDPHLARTLYSACEIGLEIPYELFQAVAEVLALVYRVKEAV